jgi:two-component sensor histidine kinase
MPIPNRAVLRQSWNSWIYKDGVRVGPLWLQFTWTLLFCAGLAVGFTILGFFAYGSGEGAWRNWAGWWHWYQNNLIVCLSIGLLIHLLFDAATWAIGGPPRLKRLRPWQRTLFFSAVPLTGVVFGWPLGLTLAGTDITAWVLGKRGANAIAGSLLIALLLTFLFHQWFAIKARQIDAEKRAAEAQLRLLQGQIEPHFLFNTLAGVISLIDTDAPRARQMLLAFTEYLRSSLTTLRQPQGPLAQELDLAENYLRLLQSRMEDRLQFGIEASDEARRVQVPPLLLQPLIENAVVHGIEPSIEGGRVSVQARVEDGRLLLTVHDNGRGLGAAPRRGGNGMALANIRERLQARYGSAATLDVVAASPGTRAVLSLPTENAPNS